LNLLPVGLVPPGVVHCQPQGEEVDELKSTEKTPTHAKTNHSTK